LDESLAAARGGGRVPQVVKANIKKDRIPPENLELFEQVSGIPRGVDRRREVQIAIFLLVTCKK
jgi:hypothetical protein